MVASAGRVSVWAGGLVGEEGAEEAVVDFGGEDRDSLSVGCAVVGVGSLPSVDEPVERRRAR